jgi:hypothetical protein
MKDTIPPPRLLHAVLAQVLRHFGDWLADIFARNSSKWDRRLDGC